jgi:hypothetical protein
VQRIAILAGSFSLSKKGPNKAPEPTITAVTIRAPSSTARASRDRGSSLTFGKIHELPINS